MKIFMKASGRVLISLAIAVTVAVFGATPAGAESPSVGTKLELRSLPAVDLGDSIHVYARLLDESGKPVAKEEVVLYTSFTFMSTSSGPIEIGRATTDAAGVADIEYLPTRGGSTEVRAEFLGNTKYKSSQAVGTFVARGGQQIYGVQVGITVPFLSKWLLGGLLFIIWTLYLFVVTRVLRIVQDAAE